jgi:ABC-2 type transport system ATP-binding protein
MPPSSSDVIEVSKLTRSFTSRKGFLFQEKVSTEALRGVDLTVHQGELFGLLGPNGAGKTTLTKILSTLLLPTSGTARVLGHDVSRERAAIRPRIGLVLGGERGLYNRVSGRENLRYFADLYGLPSGSVGSRIREVLDLVGLTEAADRRVEEYSRGMKQKLHLARGLLHRPPLLFLDEPTIGLDPRSARELRKLVRTLSSEGVSIFLTTHYMFEAEELCHRIGILARGQMVACDTPAGLQRLVGGEGTVELESREFEDAELARLRSLPGVSRVLQEPLGTHLRVTLRVRPGRWDPAALSSALAPHPDLFVRERRTTLEDAYLDLVEQEGAT